MDEFSQQLRSTGEWLSAMPIQRLTQERSQPTLQWVRDVMQQMVRLQVHVDQNAYDGAVPTVPTIAETAVGAQLRVIGSELLLTLDSAAELDAVASQMLADITNALRDVRKYAA